MRRLGYLGSATLRQNGQATEVSAALYSSGDASNVEWFGRFWDPFPAVELRTGLAAIRFHDATDAEVEITRVAASSGRFTVVGQLRNLREA